MTTMKVSTIAALALALVGTLATAQNSHTILAEEIGEEPVAGEETMTSFTLVLNPPPSTANSGDIVNFTGRLSGNDGSAVAGKTVLINDHDPHGMDNLLGAELTGSNGEFVVQWTAKRMDPRDNTVEVYAGFRDDPGYGGAKSSQYIISVTDSNAQN